MNWVIVSTIHFSPSNDFFLPVMTFSPTREVRTLCMSAVSRDDRKGQVIHQVYRRGELVKCDCESDLNVHSVLSRVEAKGPSQNCW